MKEILTLMISCILFCSYSYGQEEMLEIQGAIQISDSEDPTPDPGTIRWTGSDFEGWNGLLWVSLTGHASIGSVTDIDGNIYQTIRIGHQEWMVQNLRVTKYNDNTTIDEITNPATWQGLTTGAWCWYNNDNSFEMPYGKLYNWYAVSTANLCPDGWSVPSQSDWTTLVNYLGGSGVAGGKLKETGLAHWNSPNTGATNESGFTALASGWRNPSGLFGDLGEVSVFWSSTPTSPTEASYLSLNFDLRDSYSSTWFKKAGFSVRCMKY